MRRDHNDFPRKVAIIGSQGVPPRYGGFETLVDNILRMRSPERVEYTVFCSRCDMKTDLSEYRGAKLRYIDIPAHGKSSVAYDIISMLMSVRGFDAVLLLGVSGGIFVPVFKLLSRAKVIVNVDGLEYRRNKWTRIAKWFLKLSLGICVRHADEIVTDNQGISELIENEYKRKSQLIAYGGDHALRDINAERQRAILSFYSLRPFDYDLAICRIEPENNVETTLRTYAGCGRRIVMVGNWDHSDFAKEMYQRYSSCHNIMMLDSIYDLDILFALRANAALYIHGHSAGGTNPSLVEAMMFGRPILAFDVIYNRKTTDGLAYYYSDSESLANLLIRRDLDGGPASIMAHHKYIWAKIAKDYESLF